ncbi:oxysterol-binding protein-like protein 1 [Syncephalis fuscata]|nr:oxysterol-binding protein-like protein 1 [Syncephalis fuscata]
MDSPGISQHSLSRAVTTPPKETTLATDNQDAPDGEQNRFKLMWGILKKLVGARDIVAMRISVPAQLLEPMSNLEYWNYMDRPDYFACLADPDDPVDRMLGVVRWWYTKDLKHIHGRLVKPYNSTLGEQFICRWRVPKDVAPGDTAVDEAQLDSFSGSENNNYKITYITEQISHHPPVSAFQYACEEKGLTAVGIDHICVGFSGTSIKIAAGEQNLGVFLRMRTRDGEEYHLTHPHAHITGWLRGNPYIVQADRCIVTCAKTGLQVVLECKDEKWIGKPKHLISGKVFRYDPDEPNTASNGSRTKDARKDKKSTKINDADVVATIGGSWQGVMDYTKTGTKKQTLIDLSNLKPVAKIVRPVEEQSEHESRKVWYDVTSNIVQKNFPAANRAKQTIEEQQRKIAVERKNNERDEFSSVYFNVPEPGIPVLVKQPDQY